MAKYRIEAAGGTYDVEADSDEQLQGVIGQLNGGGGTPATPASSGPPMLGIDAAPKLPANGASGSWDNAPHSFGEDISRAYRGEQPDPSTKYAIAFPRAREASGDTRLAAPEILQGLVRAISAPRRSIEGAPGFDPQEEARNMALNIMGGGLTLSSAPKLAPEAGALTMNALPRGIKALSRGVTAVAQPLVDRFDPEGAVARTLAKRIQQQNPGMSLDDAIKATEQRMQELGPDAVLADAGDATRGLADVMVQTPGESRTLARKTLGNRDASEGSRMVKSVKENVSDADFYDAKAANKASKTASGPHYEQAYAENQNVTSPGLQMLVEQEPLIRQGMARGLKIQRIEASTAREPFKQDQFGVVADFNEAGDPIIKQINTTPLRLWHATRKGLDGMLEGYRDKTTGKLVLDDVGVAIKDLRASLDEEVKRLTGGPEGNFAKGDAAYADAAKLDNAMQRGRNFVSGDEEMTSQVFKAMPAAEQDAYRAGVAREMQGMIRKNGSTPASIRAALKDTGISDKLKTILPTETQYNKFISDLQREGTFKETNRIRYGSQTFGRGAEDAGATQDIVGNAVSAGAQAMRGDVGGAAMSAVRSAQNFLKRAQLPQSTRDRIGNLLLSQDPEEKAKAFKLLRNVKSSGWVYSP
jgi:hypothetical protein